MDCPEIRNAVEQGWMRVGEIAAYLGVTQQRVSQLAAQDGVPTTKIGRGPADVEAVGGGAVDGSPLVGDPGVAGAGLGNARLIAESYPALP